MPALRQDFVLFTRSDCKLTVTVRNAAGATVDLTGAQISWVLLDPSRQAVWVTKSSAPGGGIEIPDQLAEPGVFRVVIVAADTQRLPSAVCHHQATVALGGETSPVVYGDVSVQKSEV